MKKLSILVITYNHEKYIRQAMESVLMQKIDFDYEIILADDCSTDNTQAILMEYVNKYPDIFKPHFGEKNLGVTKNYQRSFKLCHGEYVAIIEGDDYWTDVNKLAKQIKILSEHREVVVCFNRFWGWFVDMNKFTPLPHFAPSKSEEFQFLTLEDLIRDNFIGNFSTCMYRNSSLQKLDEKIFDLNTYDWMVNMTLAQFGVIAYVPDIMSVYRIHGGGTWSGLNAIAKNEKTLAAIDSYDKFFDNKFAAEFSEVRNRYQKQLLMLKLKSNPVLRIARGSLRKIYRAVKLLTPPGILVILNWLVPPLFKQVVNKTMR